MLMCGARANRESSPYYKAPSQSFGALSYNDPVDLVAAWVAARERGDVRAATALCAEDLRFETGGERGEVFELSGRDAIAEQVFTTPAPPFPPSDVLRPLHLVAKSDGGGRNGTSAYIVARELRLQQQRLRQEFTVISLKGWKNAMIILRIAVARDALRTEELISAESTKWSI